MSCHLVWSCVVGEKLLIELEECLEGSVEVVEDRRGFGKDRGVPDSVFWLRPSDDRVNGRLLPFLVELEGSFGGAKEDFAKFARRYGDPGYQYCVQWPVIGTVGRDPLSLPIQYEIIGIRANQLTSDREISERQMHAAFEDWFDRFLSRFETTATIREFLEIPFIEWHIEFSMFGHRFECSVPVLINRGEELVDEEIKRMVSPTLPCVVVVNGKYDGRSTDTDVHNTTIEFLTSNPIKFKDGFV